MKAAPSSFLKFLVLFFGIISGLVSNASLFAQPKAAPTPEIKSEKPISQTSDLEEDSAIHQRLSEIFSQIEPLHKVGITVKNGVVTLEGEVPSRTALEQAGQLAQQVVGVVEVQNNLTLFKQLEKQVSVSVDRLKSMGNDFINRLPLFGIAFFLVLFFYFLGKILTGWKGLFKKISPNPFISDILRSLVQIGFVFIGLLFAFEILDATAFLGTLLGAAGLAGLAVGFALKETVENYLASILLSLRQPFSPNDLVQIGEHEGIVVSLNTRATILMTLDGNHLRIPNAQVFKSSILNFTRNPQRRLGFRIGVDAQLELLPVQKLGESVLLAHKAILKEPPPIVWVEEIGDSNVVLQFYAWMDQREFDFLKVRSEAIRIVKKTFDENGIIMPEPIYKVRLQEEGLEKDAALADSELKRSIQPKSLPTSSEEDADVSIEDHLGSQVARERKAKGEEDLLDESKPQEY